MTRVIGICSGKGGVGKTTLAVNLALALKKFKKRVIVIDCNLSTPHLAYYLGVSDYKYTLNDALLGKVDIVSSINNYYGVMYVPASLDLNDLIGIDPTKFKKCLKRLVRPGMIDFIILDSAPGLGREAVSVLDASDEIIFVTTPFAPMINDVVRCVNVAKELDGNKNMSIVLNMTTNGKHEIIGKNISTITGLPIIGDIPFDKNVVYSLVSKLPIVEYSPNSLASIGIMQIAARLAGADYKPSKRIGLYKLLARIKNHILPSKVIMPQSVKDVKEDIFIE
jgi:septum site-determining protein MinD